MLSNPNSSGERMLTLDALRGFAVMGILTMNIVAFAMPETAYFNPVASGAASESDIWSWAFSFILFDGKMRGLFSLLFGASMMLVIARADEKGEDYAASHFRRMAWLAAFGLFHFYLIWWGDILFLYAVAGSIAFAFAAMQSRQLITMALLIYLAGTVLMSAMMGGLYILELAAGAPDASAETIAEYKVMVRELTGGYVADVVRHRSDYTAIAAHRMTEDFWRPFSLLWQNLFETLPLILIGMAMLQNGFLAGAASVGLYRRWAFIGLGIGGAGYGLLTWLAFTSDFSAATMPNIAFAWSAPFLLLMTVGYAAGLVLVIRWAANAALVVQHLLARVAAAGRAAFTNYLGTSIIMTTVFYGYGYGLFGSVGRAELWVFVAAACALMLLWSKPWLAHFRYGPLEWLWRSLARGRRQNMR